jgi:saccharopine dehydrogenase-like NADP-dependent oxidoreductase
LPKRHTQDPTPFAIFAPMQNILVLGSGRSSSSLIQYLLEHARENEWAVTVGDVSKKGADEKIKGHERGSSISFDINASDSGDAIANADVVVSLLPAHFHPLVAVKCLEHRKHLLTASYVSDEMRGFDTEAKEKNLLFLNECGLDPGIDHMSAIQVIDRIRKKGGSVTSFESFTGGLIAPETDPENPWRYKFTWNPRNVVMAGQSTAKFLQEGKYKYVPYQQLFKRVTPVHVPGFGEYEGYANRDSLKYLETYGLQSVKTMLRGTLRNKGFCSAWDIFVQLGCCDDSYEMEGVASMTHESFLNSFLNDSSGGTLQQRISNQLGRPLMDELTLLSWLDLFKETKVGLEKGTPAQVLEHILNKKWKLDPNDKDQIVMWHRFFYKQNGKQKQIQAYLIATGTDSTYTAMAQTVGLPLALATKLLLNKKIQQRGVTIPITEEFYNPILSELKDCGIELSEIEIG